MAAWGDPGFTLRQGPFGLVFRGAGVTTAPL